MMNSTKDAGRVNKLLVVMTTGFLVSTPLQILAGGFIFGDGQYVTHPSNYLGSGGVIPVNVCIVPGSANATDMEQSVKNNIAQWNKLQSTSSNVRSMNIPNTYDFESVSLHEVGHCLGMSHPNLGSQTGVSGSNTNYTHSAKGADGVYAFGSGVDGIIGTEDDVRGDDVNYHYFNPANNNPFSESSIIDSTTYTRDAAQLPSGDLFPANADRTVSATARYKAPHSEAVMQQGTFNDEIQRTLNHDDVATIRYGQSGLDAMAGNSDDYTVNLTYGGISTVGCDINISMDAAETGFAVCKTQGSFLVSGSNIRITSANIYFNPNFDWYFNSSAPCSESVALTATEWKMISLPCQVGVSTSAKLEDVFGDDLGTTNYNVDWAVFTYEYTADGSGGFTAAYRLVPLSEELSNDKGYWIITNDTGKTVDVQGEYNSQMDADLFVKAPANVSGWNMIGMPFRYSTTWADTLVVDTTGDVLSLTEADPALAGGGTSCTGAAPTADCKVASTSFSFDGTAYTTLTPASGSLSAFDAAWVFSAEAGLQLRFTMSATERTTP